MAVLPDSNVVIRYLNGDPAVRSRFEEGDVRLSVIILAELWYGALNSGRRRENLQKLDRLFAGHPVIPITIETAKECARIRRELKQAGRPIPVNDLWLAATARSEGYQLISADDHFGSIQNLDLANW